MFGRVGSDAAIEASCRLRDLTPLYDQTVMREIMHTTNPVDSGDQLRPPGVRDELLRGQGLDRRPGPRKRARAFGGDKGPLDLFPGAPHPFGGVRVSTGTPPTARFPGQWFQSETGLHQNWMRDYDPTTGRYMQADPLGLVEGSAQGRPPLSVLVRKT
jgi:RHS repeat-associated protein